ncbi:MAG: lasso RiPP family leader peptide-containing protein [Candidatus Eisenbacteria bacterium]|nr:lasso RiPP family leader peptide-containing protein [Candidatus Eisenbacteria bacterium]
MEQQKAKLPYEKPEVVRHGNLKEITMTSFTPPDNQMKHSG